MTNLINEIKAAQIKAMAELAPFKTKNEAMYNTVLERMELAIIDMTTIENKKFEILGATTAKSLLSAYYTSLNREYTASNKIDKVIWTALAKHL